MTSPSFSPIHTGTPGFQFSVPSHSFGNAGGTGSPNSFKLQTSLDVLALQPLPTCIKGVLQDQGLVAIYGPSGSGKSFLTLDIAVALAGRPNWFGYRVKHKVVVYVALEGEAGIRNRVAAIVKSEGLPMPTDIHYLLGQPFNLMDGEAVAALADAINAAVPAGGAVVFLDTLNRAAPGADENASTDMGLILQGAKELQRLIGGLVVLVHHTGKDFSKGLRGHSSLLAALDAAIEVSRDGDARSWRLAKSKDGEDGKVHTFKLEVVQLGVDSDGDPISSCVIKPDGNLKPKPKAPQGGNQRIAWDAIRLLLASGQTGLAGVPAGVLSVDLEAAITAIGAKLPCESSKRRERSKTAISGLINRGLLGLQGGFLWEI